MATFEVRSILVGTDLGKRSERSLRAAAAVAALTDADLHVLHAFEFPDESPASSGAATFPDRVADAERALAEQIRRIAPSTPRPPRGKVMIYLPSKALLEYGRDVAADLIVLGRHHRQGVADKVLGTTADAVVREAEVPCLVVPADLSLPLRRVTVAVDPDEPTPEVAGLAASWARILATSPEGAPQGLELRLLAVVSTNASSARSAASSALDGVQDSISGRNPPSGKRVRITMSNEVVEAPTPAEGILRSIVSTPTELLVIATHGPGALRRALIGSVASAVARDAPVPVLLVPPALWQRD